MAIEKMSDLVPGQAAGFLLEEHIIGGIRDQGDLDIAKYHVTKTLRFCIDFFKSIEGTIEEKVEYLQKELDNELSKFRIKQDHEIQEGKDEVQ